MTGYSDVSKLEVLGLALRGHLALIDRARLELQGARRVLQRKDLSHKGHTLLLEGNEVFYRSESFLCQVLIVQHPLAFGLHVLLPSHPQFGWKFGRRPSLFRCSAADCGEQRVQPFQILNPALLHEQLKVWMVEQPLGLVSNQQILDDAQ